MGKTHTIRQALLEGAFWSWLVAGVLATVLLLINPRPVRDNGPLTFFGQLFGANFASRWDGGCHGWIPGIALLHVLGDFLAWWWYVTIACVLARLHPILESVRQSGLTVFLMVCIFITCGLTHLFDAYATFHPLYGWTGLFKIFAGAVGLIGAFYIAYSLTAAFAVVAESRGKLEEFMRRNEGR